MATQSPSSPLLEVEDDQIVEMLLRVANGSDDFLKARREEVLRFQAEFKPLVQMARDAPQALYEQEFSARLRELAQGGVTVRPGSVLQRNGRSRFVYYRDFATMHALLSQALLLLLDEPYSRTLCRCKLPSCGKFYVAKKSPGGGPVNRTYCSRAHRDAHHNSYERKTATAKGKARHK